MNITGINHKLTFIYTISEHMMEADIPFTGEELVATEYRRETVYTEIIKFRLNQETIDQYKSLIDSYGILEWIGKTPSAPKTPEEGSSIIAQLLTLKFDDGTTAQITFREVSEEIGNEASAKFRQLFFETVKEDNKISEEKIYPTLKDCRELKEEHGPVIAVETSTFENGMMYNSNIWRRQTIEKIPDKEGIVRVTLYRKQGDLPEQTDIKEVASDIFTKIQDISDRENLPVWNYAAIDPSLPREIVFDYTFNAEINIYYDDSLITGAPRVKRTIGEAACKMGGAEVDKQISELIKECVAASGAKIEESTANPYLYMVDEAPKQPGAMPMAGMGMNQLASMQFQQAMNAMRATSDTSPAPAAPVSDEPWTCTCGKTGLTGKFCPECGNPRC